MREAHACPPKHVHRTMSGIVHTVAQPRAANSTRIQILVNVFGTWTHENRMLSYPRVVGADWLRYKHDITIKSTLKMLCFALECLASGLAFQRAATQFGEHSDVKLSSLALARWLVGGTIEMATTLPVTTDCIESRAIQMKSIRTNWQTVWLVWKVTRRATGTMVTRVWTWMEIMHRRLVNDLMSFEFHINSRPRYHRPGIKYENNAELLENRSKNEQPDQQVKKCETLGPGMQSTYAPQMSSFHLIRTRDIHLCTHRMYAWMLSPFKQIRLGQKCRVSSVYLFAVHVVANSASWAMVSVAYVCVCAFAVYAHLFA